MKIIDKVFSKRNTVLLKQLVVTDFKLRYQDSVLGFAWSMLNPLFTFVVLYFVFDKFFGMGRMAGVEHYPVALLLGIILWNFFSEATSLGMGSIVGQGDLLRKINFPKYIIVISGTISSLINLLLSTVILFIFAVFNGVTFTWRVILLPINFLEMYAFALAIAFILGTLYVKFRDIGHIWGIIIQTWFYGTPIIYPLVMVDGFSHKISQAILLLPPAQIIEDARYNVVAQSYDTVWNYIGNPFIQIIPLLIVLALSVFAVFYFKKNSKYFAEEI
ncbi:MAG: ABC transporter permease [Bifidobacteriaceae bacterium]|jgi:ABC-2 type transport system permease protein|nr:ABC transporter permease [Bifidobacteriaceae bacterium]